MAGEFESGAQERAIATRALRAEIAHSLSSPVRAMAILSDLLVEALRTESPNLDTIRQISEQFSELAIDTSNRLSAFVTTDDI